jgi:membrane-associated phospholipid phosphatase
MMLHKRISAAKEDLLDFDRRAQHLFKPYKDSPAVRLLDVASKLGDQPAIRTLSGVLMVIGIFARSDRLVRAGARMMIAHETATAAKNLVKTNIDRTRPRSATNREEKKVKKGRHTAKEKTSFPSGHSAGAIAAARAFSREYPDYAAPALGAATLIAAGQVPRCAHYPTDVAAGLVVGLAAEELVNAGWTAARMDERSELGG